MKVYPILEDFFNAAEKADATDPRYRNVKLLFQYLKKIMKINSRILGHFSTRTSALTSFDWNINDNSNQHFEKLDEVKTRCKPVINFLISQHANAALFGSNLYILDLLNKENQTQIIVKQKVDQEQYDYDYPFVHYYNNDGAYQSSTDLQKEKYTLLDYVPAYARGGILRTIMPLEIIRFDMILENSNWLRKLKGILQIINKGASDDDKRNAENAAATAIQHNYLITGEEIEFKLNEIAGTGGVSFKQFIDFINAEIAIAILGQANTSELPHSGGSRAAVQVQQSISKDIYFSDMLRVENLINAYLEIDFEANYGVGKMPYKFGFNYAEEQDIEKNANALSILKSSNIPLIKAEAYKLLGMTVPEPGDELL